MNVSWRGQTTAVFDQARQSLTADIVFGWRQIRKYRVASAAAVLSLALGIGASIAAFWLIDACFLRPLPVAEPQNLYVVTYDSLFEGRISNNDLFDDVGFQRLRGAVSGQAELMAIGYQSRVDLTFGSDQEMERVWRQQVSGSMFGDFGLKPALGRLLIEQDDHAPPSRSYGVISYDYWSRRFANDPTIVGRRFRIGDDVLEIVGVAPRNFSGTDPGIFTDLFIPAPAEPTALPGAPARYCRIWLRPKRGGNLNEIRDRLSAALHAYRTEQVKTWSAERRREEIDYFVAARVSLLSAGAGWSNAQRYLTRGLTIFAVLVASVLLIACVNVANLMEARTAARRREMALRVSLGAGRARLIQLILAESAILGAAASALALAFAWWAAPFVVAKLTVANQPLRLALSPDWRVTAFALAVTCAVILLFGMPPALRASSMRPASALKSGDSRGRRLTNALVAAQAAFCLFVLFVAGLFIATFQRMANQPTGFSTAHVLTAESASRTALSPASWYHVAQRLRSLPGVQSAAVAQYALMSFNAQTRFVWANGHAPDGTWSHSTWFLGISPEWFDTMGVPLLDGRDLRWDDAYPNVAVVNETFARRYFDGASPVGRTFELHDAEHPNAPGGDTGTRVTVRIVGLARDARYEDMRLPIPATAYVPFRATRGGLDKTATRATFIVRTTLADPLAIASALRREIPLTDPAIQVDTIATQQQLVESQTMFERLLAILSLFFAAVALLLAAIGLYGVLHHAVFQRRREIGIRMAVGAQPGRIVRLVVADAMTMVLVGALAGAALGAASVRYIGALLYHVTPTDARVLAVPLLTLLGAALLAALPPVMRAVRVDPVQVLRAE